MMKKTIAVILCAAMLLSVSSVGAWAESTDKQYIIESPYDAVDWDSWGSYKTQLHCHTTASDGFQTVAESVAEHYDYNYDILSITDHGTLNRGWNNEPQLIPLVRFVKRERTKMMPVTPLTEEVYQSYLDGSASAENRTHEVGMLDVPLGVELNMATPFADCHLTGYFSEYGQGLAGVFGDYETPSAGVRDAGGISMLSHVGEYVYIDKDSEDHVGQPVDEYYVNKFAKIFMDNQGASVGMGINSARDEHTRCDRILYDQILQKTIPNGVTPWCFTFSDAHTAEDVNNAYTLMLCESHDLDDFRSAMENGCFFSVSHFSNGVELNGMPEMPKYDYDKSMEEYRLSKPDVAPAVTKVVTDSEAGTISVEGVRFDEITWVSNGQVIKRESNITDGKAVLDLNDPTLQQEPSLYVRFYIASEKGICYSNPMVIREEGADFEPVEIPETQDISTFLRKLVTFLDILIFQNSQLVRAFKIFALGYDPMG